MPILVGPLGKGFYLIAMLGCVLASFFSLPAGDMCHI